MNGNQIFRGGARGCFINLVITLLAICAMAFSTNVHYPEHRSCGGMLGAGFPVLFICDDWGGGSPTSSWGKITLVDIPNGGVRPTGFFVDFLFYTILLWVAWFIGSRFFQKRVSQRDLWLAIFMSMAFIFGFLCAFLTFQSSSLYMSDTYYRTTPTPIIPSPTAFGTLPPVIVPPTTPTNP